MKRRGEGRRRWRVGLVASIACLGSVLVLVTGQGSAGANSNKPFAVVICAPGQSCSPGSPPIVAPGPAPGMTRTPASLTAVISNETAKGAGLRVGAVNLTAPAGVTVVSASIGGTAIGNCTPKTPKATSCLTGSVIELRNLDISPGGSLAVSMSVDTPPPPGCTKAAPCQWSAVAKQCNDFNGSGNDFTLDAGSSQLAVITSSEVTCTSASQSNSCSTTLANGGATGSSAGSVSITTDATGTSAGSFYEAIDYGPHLNAASECSGVDSMHDEYISGAALQGTNARSFTVTINTTDYPGYQAQLCITTSKPFLATVPNTSDPDDNPPDQAGEPDGDEWVLQAAVPVTQPDGTPGYAGLLPSCTGVVAADGVLQATVDPSTQPCVVSRSTSGNVHTIVASFPAGFDASMRN